MPNTKSKKALGKTREFELGVFRLLRADGSGEVIEFPRTPSALVRVTEEDIPPVYQVGAMAFYSAEAWGSTSELGIDFSSCETIKEKVLKLFDHYSLSFEERYDDGSSVEDEAEEPDPTKLS